MQIKKLWIIYIIIILIISPVLTITVSSENSSLPSWNSEWLYRQEIKLPITTDKTGAIFQPIDLHVEFNNPCWAKNEKEHSVRVCCWDGFKWHELESQIYDLESIDSYHIDKCGLVFLVPETADGHEQYFIYYDDNEKSPPNYIDHVSVEDEYYYYEPIKGILAEADYYNIEEDGYCVYVVGQKGKLINRYFSQAIVKTKPETKKFDVSNSENAASFAFGYSVGPKEEDQVASDQVLVSKEILIDGNLMVEFRIVSESKKNELRTKNIYKYFYCPVENKRICVHVKHEVLKEGIVKGQINVDGTFGGILSYRSRSNLIKRMRFGEIFPYLHVFSENNQIKEYKMNTNPEAKEREYIVPYSDDCDLGEEAWISLDEGERGKAFGVIFSSNENIVKYGKNERDGIQVISANKEYLDVLGTEIDYSAVAFGRNSYERGIKHDLKIPDDLMVEYDAELFTSKENSYKDISRESEYFRTLVKYRQDKGDGSYEGEKNIYTLTVFPRFTGFFSFPIIAKISGINFLGVWAELYQDEKVVSTGYAMSPLVGIPVIKFPKLAIGDYILKIYRKIGKNDNSLIGITAVNIQGDKWISVFCTWQKEIKITTRSQNGEKIEGIEFFLLKNDTVLLHNFSTEYKDITMMVSYNIFTPYMLKAYYKGFIIFNSQISRKEKNVDIILDLYDLNIDVKDQLGFSPGVNVRPLLTSSEMDEPIDLTPEDIGNDKYLFKNLLPAKYKLYISYGRFSDELNINIPKDGDSANIKFSAVFNLKTKLFDSRGNRIKDSNIELDIKRDEKTIYESISHDEVVNLPPGKYSVNVYLDDKLVGIKTVELNNDKSINIVTNLKSILPTIITGIALVFIIELIALIFFKRISLNTFLKLLALALVFISLFQPWWALNGYSDSPIAEKSSEMFIFPQSMMESILYEDKTTLELATLPELFTDFVGTLLFIVYIGIFLLATSFIPNILLKRRFFIVLISGSIIFLTLVALAFSFGMSKICEISLGSLYGENILNVLLPNGQTVNMQTTWGLGLGFYLCIFSALILIFTGILDFLRKRKWPKILFAKKVNS